MNVWREVFLGFLITFSIVISVRAYKNYRFWKVSFYTELYSGFFEYLKRKKTLEKMSKSYWIENDIGEHRIFFQATQPTNENFCQQYILLLLTSGLYIIQLHNEIGIITIRENQKFMLENNLNNNQIDSIELLNPVDEAHKFSLIWKKLINQNYNQHCIIVYSDDTVINVEEKSKENIPFINRRYLYKTIKNIHDNSSNNMDKNRINELYDLFINKSKGLGN